LAVSGVEVAVIWLTAVPAGKQMSQVQVVTLVAALAALVLLVPLVTQPPQALNQAAVAAEHLA
jgi:hypothetical protein